MPSPTTSTAEEFAAKWRAYREMYARHGGLVDAGKLLDDVLADFAFMQEAMTAAPVSLIEASTIGGFSVDHLQRLVANGTLENVGRRGRPRIRRGDVPMKPGHALRNAGNNAELPPRRRMALAVITANTGSG